MPILSITGPVLQLARVTYCGSSGGCPRYSTSSTLLWQSWQPCHQSAELESISWQEPQLPVPPPPPINAFRESPIGEDGFRESLLALLIASVAMGPIRKAEFGFPVTPGRRGGGINKVMSLLYHTLRSVMLLQQS